MPPSRQLPHNVKLIGKTTTKGGSQKSLFSVVCPFCNKSRNITRKDHAIRLSSHRCKSCSNKKNHPQGEIDGVRVSWFNKYKLSCSHRSLKWDLDIEYVARLLAEQDYKCALSKLPISASGNFEDITASIDRIDNSKGYTQNNIQLVHKKINMMRGSLPIEDFKFFCNAVADRVKW